MMEIIAHRGDSVRFIENTLEAFWGAIDAGADMIECDVRMCRDAAVVFHDTTLFRLHGIPKAIADCSATELEKLGIPTLQTVLDTFVGSIPFQFEIKEEAALDPLLDFLTKQPYRWWQKHGYLSSAESAVLARWSLIGNSNVPFAVVLGPEDRLPEKGREAIAAWHISVDISAAVLAEIIADGRPIRVWTVATAADMSFALRLQARGIFVNDPRWARNALQETGENSGEVVS